MKPFADTLWDTLIKEKFLTSLDLYFADLYAPLDQNQRAFWAAVMQASRQGHLCLDLDHLDSPQGAHKNEWKRLVLEGSQTAPIRPDIVREGSLCYLQKNYFYESEILKELKRLCGTACLPPCSADLTEEQKSAFDLVRCEYISIIEGGPGTGKTYLTKELVKSLGPHARVILTAPTGKAVGRLKEKNRNAICGTLHSILGIKSEKQIYKHSPYIQADLIVVDEASMVDVKLLLLLLRSLQKGQRIVFLGDGNQLPPVESGSVFHDLIDLLPTAHLKNCLRSDQQEILQMASSILKGTPPSAAGTLSFETIEQFFTTHPQGVVLTPLREGPWGVKSLNERLVKSFSSHKKNFSSMPILITRNEPISDLYNGDTGELFYDEKGPSYALFETSKGIQRYTPSMLPPYEPAYVLSIHKSQGSEFKDVLVLAPPGMESFGREILYTAVTRARFSVSIIGNDEIIKKSVEKVSRKSSGLCKRWN